MPTSPDSKINLWPERRSIYIESLVILLLCIFVQYLRNGSIEIQDLFSTMLGLSILGSLSIWFVNKFALERILQSRINANKVTQFLPFELVMASVAITSLVYLIFYLIFMALGELIFVLENFLQGLFVTAGLSLLIVIIYAGNQIWSSWWSDGEFLFQPREVNETETELPESITITNPKGTVKQDLSGVRYFISESKITFLVDSAGKKWMTQYNLSELEEMLGQRFFRLNRSILVSREEISEIRKLPNHRLLVTLGSAEENHTQTISRYKSTRFKQWYRGTDHSVMNF